MRTIRPLALSLALLTVAGLAVAAPKAPAPLALGKVMPKREVKMESVAGTQLAIADAAGKKGTLVVFMCNHCPWVQAWQGRIAKIGNAAMEQGIGVIAINSNDVEAYPSDDMTHMKEQAEAQGFKFPYVMDASSDMARVYGASKTPEAFLFDAKGKLVYHGAIDDNAKDESAVSKTWLGDAVQAVAAGKAVAEKETKAFGCGIKLREGVKASKAS